MTLQAAGQIALSEVQTEFGGTNPISITEYYRNGSEGVPDTTANASIPTAAKISLSDFYNGDVAPAVSINWLGMSRASINSGADATIEIGFKSDGSTYKTLNAGSPVDVPVDAWLSNSPLGTGANYEVTAIKASGNGIPVSSVTLDGATWHNMASTAWFQLTDVTSSGGPQTADITIVMREVGNAASEVTNTLTLTATQEP